MELRVCNICGVSAKNESELERFAKDSSKPHGRRNRCRECERVRSRSRDKKSYNQKYRARRPDYHQRWREANPDYYRKWREANPDYHRDWRKANPEYTLAVRERRRQTRASAVAIYGGACVTCGSNENLEFDHVNNDGKAHREIEEPFSMITRIVRQGSQLEDWSLQLLCKNCHRRKTYLSR